MKVEKDGYKKLMIAVLTQMIIDYIHAIKIGGLNFGKMLNKDRIKIKKTGKKNCDAEMLRNVDTMTRGEEARYYIFEDFRESEEYVFGFKFICSYIGLDPEKFRKKIKEKREEFWKDIHI
jgi:hypothetical protein